MHFDFWALYLVYLVSLHSGCLGMISFSGRYAPIPAIGIGCKMACRAAPGLCPAAPIISSSTWPSVWQAMEQGWGRLSNDFAPSHRPCQAKKNSCQRNVFGFVFSRRPKLPNLEACNLCLAAAASFPWSEINFCAVFSSASPNAVRSVRPPTGGSS
jgi:hypothetical protein